jgi:NAD(P)-dependent dehydrogenase (short-subunit alcohol dehydrogenase family)
MQRLPLAEKVAIVTGATGLLGQEHCAALAAAGAHVVALDVDVEAVSAFARRLGDASAGRVLGLAADVTDPGALERVRDQVLGELGAIDVLVNNAAIDDKFAPGDALSASSFENYALERFRRQLDVNVTGVFLCCQKLGSPMAARGSGSIVNVASTYGISAPRQDIYKDVAGQPRFFKGPAYPTSKAAVIQLTRYLASYWGHTGVRVNALSPGGVFAGQDPEFVRRYSEQTPLGRMARRSDYRGAVVFLASDDSEYMTGSNLVVDGGWTAW